MVKVYRRQRRPNRYSGERTVKILEKAVEGYTLAENSGHKEEEVTAIDNTAVSTYPSDSSPDQRRVVIGMAVTRESRKVDV